MINKYAIGVFSDADGKIVETEILAYTAEDAVFQLQMQLKSITPNEKRIMWVAPKGIYYDR